MKEKEKQKRDWLPGVLMAAAISFLLFLYAPVDLYCSNIDEFWFDFDVLLRMAAMMFGISLVTLTLLYLLAAWIHSYFYRIGLAVGLAVLLITCVGRYFHFLGGLFHASDGIGDTVYCGPDDRSSVISFVEKAIVRESLYVYQRMPVVDAVSHCDY